jgi:hypothetical protein
VLKNSVTTFIELFTGFYIEKIGANIEHQIGPIGAVFGFIHRSQFGVFQAVGALQVAVTEFHVGKFIEVVVDYKVKFIAQLTAYFASSKPFFMSLAKAKLWMSNVKYRLGLAAYLVLKKAFPKPPAGAPVPT